MDRKGCFLWMAVMALLLAIWYPNQLALAQEDEKPASEGEEEEEEMTYLAWAIKSSGPIGAILFTMSFISVALTTMFVTELKQKNVMPPDLIRNFEEKLREKRYQEAYDLVRSDNSFLGKVLAAGLSKVSGGYTAVVDAMGEVSEDEALRISHRLSWLAILGTIGPLLGLLGTVEGIIASFRVIAVSKTQPKPSLLAEGISTSLFNTFEGLFVAIIATIAFMLLKNRAERVVIDVGLTASGLMSRFQSKG
jgi:biopolymer transport protein ExbB